jgi:3-isopropylmalate/(R)-2-methylmalate dehydratase small subunit
MKKLDGKAWTFGNDINTDIIIPFRFKSRTNDPNEMAKYAMYGVDQDFYNKISKGDIIVAGKNFGGGSSREQAPIAIQYAGISAVIAESFARIFVRNCFAIGLPILEVKGISKKVKQGDKLQVDFENLIVKNKKSGKSFKAEKWPDFLVKIMKDGGITKYYIKHKKFPWE